MYLVGEEMSLTQIEKNRRRGILGANQKLI